MRSRSKGAPVSTDDGEIRQRLENLGAALGDTRLPGPDAARRRARQRSRRQAGGAVLGAVAAVAVGAIAIGGLPTLNTAPPIDPAETPTDGPTDDSTGGPTDSLLLTVDDLEESSGADELVGWSTAEVGAEPSYDCAPWIGDADHVVQRSFITPWDGRLDQIVEISTPERAEARFDEVTDSVVSCVEQAQEAAQEEFRLDEVWAIDGIGDGAWIARYWTPPWTDEGAMLVVVSIVQVGDTVTTLAEGGMAMDANLPPSHDLVRLAGERLCAASGRACSAEPAAQRVHPAPFPDQPGWLTVQDIEETSGIEGLTEGGEVQDTDGSYGFACIEVDAAADGAASVERRMYFDPVWEIGESLDQAIARFPSVSAAEDHFDRIAEEAAECGDGMSTESTGEVAGPGFRGESWRSTSEEFGTAFAFGAVVNGSAVTVLTFPAPEGFGGQDMDADQLGALLTRAGERLADLQ